MLLLVGYVIPSDSENTVRLALNLNFGEYIDIPKGKILHAPKTSTLEFGGTCVWIEKDAVLKHASVKTAKTRAEDFIGGGIVEKYRRPAVPGSAIIGQHLIQILFVAGYSH